MTLSNTFELSSLNGVHGRVLVIKKETGIPPWLVNAGSLLRGIQSLNRWPPLPFLFLHPIHHMFQLIWRIMPHLVCCIFKHHTYLTGYVVVIQADAVRQASHKMVFILRSVNKYFLCILLWDSQQKEPTFVVVSLKKEITEVPLDGCWP